MQHALPEDLAVLTTALDALAEHFGASVLIIDVDKQVLHWGGAAEREFGITRAQMIGQHCLKGLRAESCLRACPLAEALVGDKRVERVFRADGTNGWYERLTVPYRDQAGAFFGGIEFLVPTGRPLGAADRSHELLPGIVSNDPKVHRTLEIARQLAATPLHLHIEGEVGTGRMRLAREIHRLGRHPEGLFKHRMAGQLGLEDLASRSGGPCLATLMGEATTGTLLIEEIADVGWELQPLLLRLLRPYAADRAPAAIRVITTSARPLEREVAAGRVRTELYHTLRSTRLVLPPLRERIGDIDLLIERCLERLNAWSEREVTGVHDDALPLLRTHPWPGNVDELCKALGYAHAVAGGAQIRGEHLPPYIRSGGSEASPRERVVEATELRAEIERIRAALEACDGQLGPAADKLGMSRSTLWRRRRKLGI